jgi:hypothetical protein
MGKYFARNMAKPVVCVYVDGQPEYEKHHKEG